MRPAYLIGHFNGIRSHFIASIIVQLHRDSEEAITYSEQGHAHDFTWSYLHNKTNIDSLSVPNYEKVNHLDFVGSHDDPDPLVICAELRYHEHIDYSALLKKHQSVTQIFIEAQEDDFPEILANDFYKTYLILGVNGQPAVEAFNFYKNIVSNYPECRQDLQHIGELNDDELRILVTEIIGRSDTASIMKRLEDRKDTIPDSIPMYSIQYRDIMQDKNKVLSLLEDITGHKRTNAIEASYDNYVGRQIELYNTKMKWLYPK